MVISIAGDEHLESRLFSWVPAAQLHPHLSQVASHGTNMMGCEMRVGHPCPKSSRQSLAQGLDAKTIKNISKLNRTISHQAVCSRHSIFGLLTCACLACALKAHPITLSELKQNETNTAQKTEKREATELASTHSSTQQSLLHGRRLHAWQALESPNAAESWEAARRRRKSASEHLLQTISNRQRQGGLQNVC